MGFKSIINEYYARDISKKIRSSKELYKQQGKAIGGRPPYGYMPDPADKTHYVINPETAPIVKRIFAMAADGSGAYTIAKTLLTEGVWSPQNYRSGEYTGAEWNVAYIYKMLRNPAYIGSMSYNKQQKPSFKSKKIITCDESEWIVVPNCHEPIVDEKVFDLVRRKIPVKKRENTARKDNIFVGLLKCKDCGSNMSLAQHPSGRIYFMCHRYRYYGKQKCSLHYINYDMLYDLVLRRIRQNALIARQNKDCLDDYIKAQMAEQGADSRKAERKNLAKLTRRKEELDLVIQRLFEENVLGNMPAERFYEMSSRAEKERADVTAKIEALKAAEQDDAEQEANYRRFFDLMLQYADVDTLDAKMLYEAISYIEVHAPEGRKTKRTQTVEIHYRYVDKGLASPAV
jgi:hypothetical protein